ncbi:MAG: hypothetical protein ACK5M1_13940 [Xanthomarina gelatinilytica]|uniref:hypothetical protein n=1 Tax=Xanthomarina gelatinilytica TaxID=1137281 RepID=UPI003A85F842
MNTSQFWTWFQDNEHKLYILPLLSTEEQDEYMFWMQTYLKYYSDGIGFKIVFCETYAKPATLAFFTNQQPELYHAVLQLVKTAPPMDNWKIVSYRNKLDDVAESKTIGPSNFKLKLNQLYFQPVFKINDNSKITINIFTTKKVSYAKRKQFKKLCMQILVDMVGEKVLSNNVHFIRCNLKTQIPGVAIKLIHFQQFIDLIKQPYK